MGGMYDCKTLQPGYCSSDILNLRQQTILPGVWSSWWASETVGRCLHLYLGLHQLLRGQVGHRSAGYLHLRQAVGTLHYYRNWHRTTWQRWQLTTILKLLKQLQCCDFLNVRYIIAKYKNFFKYFCSRKCAELHVGWYRDRFHKNRIIFLLWSVCLQWLELSQLSNRGATGSCQEPAPGYCHLHHLGDGGVHHDQHCILHHSQCSWGPGIWSCGSGNNL